MTEMERMEKEVIRQQKEVMIGDLFRYIKEQRTNNCELTIEQAYEEIGVLEDMRMTVIEIIEFLYPQEITEKSLEELLIEHYAELEQ